MYIETARFQPVENGRYIFKLKTPIKDDLEWEIEMPALPVDQVRYIDDKVQNIWDFPRLYVDGSSWVWKYAVIKKSHLIKSFQYKIEEHETEIQKLQKLVEELSQ